MENKIFCAGDFYVRKRVANTISILELLDKFDFKDKAVAWLEHVLWEGKSACAHCSGTEKIGKVVRKAYAHWCGDCCQYFTVGTGAIMYASKLLARKWIMAIYYVLTARMGINSLQLSKAISITQKSAWYMLHYIREACDNTNYMLAGINEMCTNIIGKRLLHLEFTK